MLHPLASHRDISLHLIGTSLRLDRLRLAEDIPRLWLEAAVDTAAGDSSSGDSNVVVSLGAKYRHFFTAKERGAEAKTDSPKIQLIYIEKGVFCKSRQ